MMLLKHSALPKRMNQATYLRICCIVSFRFCAVKGSTPVNISNIRTPNDHQSTADVWPLRLDCKRNRYQSKLVGIPVSAKCFTNSYSNRASIVIALKCGQGHGQTTHLIISGAMYSRTAVTRKD